MKKFLIILLSFLFCVNLSAQPRGGTPPTRIEEEDGSPSVRARTVKFPNTSVTDNADGTASIDFIGGSLPTTYLKLDGTNTMTGNVNMSNDTWIGLGAGKGNILFDDSNDVIDVQNVDFRLPADDQKFALGAAGTTDSYLQWDSAGVDFYSSGGIYDFNAAANTDIVMNFPGTTESGKITWDEDEGTFVFGDDTGNALQWNYPVHISTDTDGKGLQIGPQDEGDAGDHPSFLSMSKKFTADTGDQFRGIHNEYQWQAQNAYNIINMVNTAKFTGTATYTQADVRGVLAQLESDNDNVTISSYRAFEAQAPAAWLGGGAFHGTLTDYYGLYINKPTAAVNEWGIYTELATPIMFGGADNGGTVGLGMVSMRATSLDQLSLEYDATTSWQFRTGSGGALLLKNDGSETIRVTENNALGIGVVPSETNNEKFATLKNDYDTSGANDQYYRKHTGTVATGGAKAFHGNRELSVYNASENQTGIFVNTYSGLQYQGTGDSTNNYGYILNLELRSTATITNLYGFTPVGYNLNNIAGTVGTYYGFRDRGFDAEDGTLSTAAYNFYGDAHRVDGGSFNGTAYGIFLEEQTVGASNYEMWIDGGGEIFFRDSAIHFGSLTDGHLDLTADVSIDLNAPAIDAGSANITTTGNIIIDSDTSSLQLGDGQDMLLSSNAPGALILTAGAADTDIVLTFTGTANSGSLSWMEGEDYFQSADHVRIDRDLLFNTGTLSVGFSYTNAFAFSGGTIIAEQTAAAGGTERMLWLPNGSRIDILLENGSNYDSQVWLGQTRHKRDGSAGRAYFGNGHDSYIEFDGNSMNFVANVVTATDDMEFTADAYTFKTQADTDLVFNFEGTTTSGTFLWDEDNDYFTYSDAMLFLDDIELLFGSQVGGDVGVHYSGDDFSIDISGAVADTGTPDIVMKLQEHAGVSTVAILDDEGGVVSTTNSDGDLNIEGRISSATLTITASSDTTDVSGINTLFINPAGATVIGGFVGGVDGQVLFVSAIANGQDITLEHVQGVGGATQDVYLHSGLDETLSTEFGGWTLTCDGTNWYDTSHAKHV